MEEFCCGCDNGGESGCMAQFCSREAWRGLPRLFVNSYFSILSTGLQRIGQFSLHFREHKTGPKSLSGLRVQPGPTSPLWKAFGGSQGKWTPPCPMLIPQENGSRSRKKQVPGVMHFWGRERKRPVFRQLGVVM